MKRIVLGLLAFVIFAAALTCTATASEVTSFSDLPETHWAYHNVMEMVKSGIFNGTSAPVNGVGTFSPDKYMTRGETGDKGGVRIG